MKLNTIRLIMTILLTVLLTVVVIFNQNVPVLFICLIVGQIIALFWLVMELGVIASFIIRIGQMMDYVYGSMKQADVGKAKEQVMSNQGLQVTNQKAPKLVKLDSGEEYTDG